MIDIGLSSFFSYFDTIIEGSFSHFKINLILTNFSYINYLGFLIEESFLDDLMVLVASKIVIIEEKH